MNSAFGKAACKINLNIIPRFTINLKVNSGMDATTTHNETIAKLPIVTYLSYVNVSSI